MITKSQNYFDFKSDWANLFVRGQTSLRIAVKSRFSIEEYSFGQTTLEQVFIEMAKQQEAEDSDEADAAVGKKGVMGVRRMRSVNEQVTEL